MNLEKSAASTGQTTTFVRLQEMKNVAPEARTSTAFSAQSPPDTTKTDAHENSDVIISSCDMEAITGLPVFGAFLADPC